MALPVHDLERFKQLLTDGCGITRVEDDRLAFASRFRAQQAVDQVGYDHVENAPPGPGGGIPHPTQSVRQAFVGFSPPHYTAELAIWGYLLNDPVGWAARGLLASEEHREVLDAEFWTHWEVGSHAVFKPGDPTDDPRLARSYFIVWLSTGVPPVKAIVYNNAATVDALNAAYLSGKYASPLFPVETNSVPAQIRSEIVARKPQEILIIGGTAVISEAVEDDLLKIASTRRIAGSSRYDTAVAVSRA